MSMYMCSKYVCVIGVDGRDMGGGGTAQCMGVAAKHENQRTSHVHGSHKKSYIMHYK